jgi:lipid-A-disaccharide synthase
LALYHIFISTAEISGDHYGAGIIKNLSERFPGTFRFSGLGGREMEAAGARIVRDLSTQSSIGLLEGLPYLSSSFRLAGELRKELEADRPDLFLCIDGQGRNLPLGVLAKKMGIKTAYLFPPLVFIWGAWNIRKLRWFDLLLCPFKPNYELLSAAGLPAVYTGHPFAAFAGPVDPAPFRKKLGCVEEDPLVAVMPGSRPQEIQRNTRTMLSACRLLRIRRPDVQVLVGLSHPEYETEIQAIIAEELHEAKIIEQQADDLLQAADCALCTSGTVTLQAAMHGVPHAICYSISRPSYLIAKWLLRIQQIGLPNILAGRELCHEFINDEFAAGDLQAYMAELLFNATVREKIISGLESLRNDLSGMNTWDIICDSIHSLLTRDE